MNGTVIEFRDVSKIFPKKDGGEQRVLDRVNFAIPEGKTTVIAGRSGQGKSVTLKLVLGLMRADGGQVLVDGQDVSLLGKKGLNAMRTRFGVLFQGSALFDSLTVYENVALPLRERTRKKEDEIRAIVEKTLAGLELSGHESKFPAQLSGGMRRRVGLARALQLDPEILLFDEPTTGLDPVMTQEIYQLFAHTQAEAGFTAIIVSHDIPRVFSLADQIIVIDHGAMDVFASSDEIQRSEKAHIQEFVRTTMGSLYQSHLVEQ
ncbi:MAG: ATP-binding cassette domain-containing protein [Desulfobulbaceae bacterium]|nr:ATP-binding cassette domain-containing protein [Desulfobulbaceae bacterium]